MQIFTNLSEIGSEFKSGSVVTLGNFDGLHLAHRALIEKLRAESNLRKLPSVLVTYYPNPAIVLGKNKDLKYIYSEEKKISLLETMGIDYLIVVPFTLELSELTAYKYIREILHELLNAKHIILGYNHFFGKNREGDFDFLNKFATEFSFSVSKLDPVYIGNEKISSSYLRNVLLEGDIEKANNILGIPFSIKGSVVHGDKRGRTIGFPTANLKINEMQLIPGNGVYCGYIDYETVIYSAMTNIGIRPTFGELNRSFEINILDFKQDLYDKDLEFFFLRKIREEKKFSGVEELKTQLENDRNSTKQIFDLLKSTIPN